MNKRVGGRKPKIAILTLHPYNYGGVLSLIKVVHKFCQNYFDPKLFFLGFDKKISAYLKSLKFSSQIRSTKYMEYDSIEIGARWAFWEPGHYKFTKLYWQEALKDYKYFFVASGTCIAAHPLTLLNKKFGAWIASTYRQDRQQRIKDFSLGRKILDKISSYKMEKIEKDILHKADLIWALSNYTKTTAENVLGKKSDKIVTCNYPMDVKNSRALSFISLNKTEGGERAIIAVGRFDDPRKNLPMLINVFSKLNKVMPNLKLYVIGPNSYQGPFLHMSCFLPCFKNITFTGLISDEELNSYYKTANLMLITSYQEGLGVVGLEALAHGVPVVATDCGGAADFIVDGKNGYLVKINDTDVMVDKALTILNSPVLAQEMSDFAVKFVQRNFSTQKIYSIFKYGLAKVYPELTQWFEECDLLLDKDVEEATIDGGRKIIEKREHESFSN